MSQVTIYLDDALEKRVRAHAKAEGVSLSKWIARKIEASEKSTWPPELLAAIGTWGDDVKIDRDFGEDAPREILD